MNYIKIILLVIVFSFNIFYTDYKNNIKKSQNNNLMDKSIINKKDSELKNLEVYNNIQKDSKL